MDPKMRASAVVIAASLKQDTLIIMCASMRPHMLSALGVKPLASICLVICSASSRFPRFPYPRIIRLYPTPAHDCTSADRSAQHITVSDGIQGGHSSPSTPDSRLNFLLALMPLAEAGGSPVCGRPFSCMSDLQCKSSHEKARARAHPCQCAHPGPRAVGPLLHPARHEDTTRKAHQASWAVSISRLSTHLQFERVNGTCMYWHARAGRQPGRGLNIGDSRMQEAREGNLVRRHFFCAQDALRVTPHGPGPRA
jgi:hypothetical protein